MDSVDDTNFIIVASYLYSGRRLIEREYGNGITTTYDYESSGCGCGGFSGLVENVEHKDGSGQTLFQTERRYDVLGNVTAERRVHQGNYGVVHRFDDAYRLTKEYWGAWLGSTNLDTYADPANTPTTFSFQREYTLDTRGNRTQVEDLDSSSNTLRSVSYSPDADTNVYDSVDGQTFSFDDMEQMTHDPSTGLYHAYDYKGQLVETDDDGDFSSPERRYFYDTHGRMRVQERWTDSMHSSEFSIYSPEGMTGGCGGVQQLTATEHLQFDGGVTSSPASVIQRVTGGKSTGSGSAAGMSPQAVAGLPGGRNVGQGVILENIDKNDNGEIDEWHYHHEDQLGTLRGMTDANGIRIAEIDTSKYGEVYQKDILYDGRPSNVSEVTSPEEGVTRIDAVTGQEFPDTVDGAVLRAADANGAYTAIVTAVDTNGTWIELDDASGDVLDAVGAGADFVIFDNRIGSVSGGAHTGGTWEDSVYISGPDTSLIDAGENFDSYIVGWHVQVDAAVPVYFEILDANGDEITVSGDVTGLITEGETEFCIIHPVGVDPETGATQEDPCVPESRYIWGGSRSERTRSNAPHCEGRLYISPIAGFVTNTGVEGAQPGSNMSGQHYMWNRVYDINTGRWTTPDPAAMPWWNVHSYVANVPLTRTDPTGLKECSFIAYDSAEGGVLGLSWWAGGAIAPGISVGGDTWEEQLEGIKDAFTDNDCTCIKEIQFWGHGSPGEPRCDNDSLDLGDTAVKNYIDWIKSKWCKDNEGVWFRMCEVAQGEDGKKFFKDAVDAFGATVSGHTHVIGPPSEQPGKVSLEPGDTPDWDSNAGTDSWVELPSGTAHDTGRQNEAGGEKVKVTAADVAKEAVKVAAIPIPAVAAKVGKILGGLLWD